jgi:U3 small nucleolar RNA-associated protein 12
MCLDISYDNTILVSGSADKTVKIWGLDFGDCHRSLFAHTDSVTSIRFQPQTHYFFSCGKEGMVKYWDADRFEQILMLPGHCSTAWGVDMSFDGALCVSVGGDRTLRVWRRSEEMVFVEEERERALGAQIDREAAASEGAVTVNGIEPTSAATNDSAKVRGTHVVCTGRHLTTHLLFDAGWRALVRRHRLGGV